MAHSENGVRCGWINRMLHYSDPLGVRHSRGTESLCTLTIPGSSDKDDKGRASSMEVTGTPNDKHENACILCDCLLRSVSLSAQHFLPIHLPIAAL